ncbi:MAG: FHA domain-containing protein [Actinomycetota bacterium]|nr:FHA domain-containing protein [Actinomycetota bacterium]
MIINRPCPHCGQPILEGSLFCLDCGDRILGAAGTAGGRRLTGAKVLEAGAVNDLTGLPGGVYIFVAEGIDRGRRFDLAGKKTLVIGRDGADINLQDPFISRRHAEIKADGRRWVMSDFGSTNGSLINDLPADGRELLDGDIIEVGYSTLVFRVKL